MFGRASPAILLLAALVPALLQPVSATILFNDGKTTAAGALLQGQTDSTRNPPPPGPCVSVQERTTVTVRIVAPDTADRVRVEVLFVERRPVEILSRNPPALRFEGIAPDSCITPVLLTGLRVASAIPYVVTDERDEKA